MTSGLFPANRAGRLGLRLRLVAFLTISLIGWGVLVWLQTERRVGAGLDVEITENANCAGQLVDVTSVADRVASWNEQLDINNSAYLNGITHQILAPTTEYSQPNADFNLLRIMVFFVGGFILLFVTSIFYFLRQIREYRLKLQHEREALAQYQIQFRLFAEAVSDVLWLADTDLTRIDYINQAFQHIWGRLPSVGIENPISILEHIHPDLSLIHI